jgi:tRNA A58 N-methylase Trm61
MKVTARPARAIFACLAAAALLSVAAPVAAKARQGRTRRAEQGRARTAANVAKKPARRPDVIYVPTPPETVDEMLRQARLKPGDVLFDLGSGDGRIPIAAAKQYGVTAVGIEIDPRLVEEAREQARREGVSNLVSFRHADMFRTDFREATVVTLYLSDRLNLLLRPKLLAELRAGARIVSHDFRMGDWPPERAVRVPWKNLYRTVYVWTVPRRRRA